MTNTSPAAVEALIARLREPWDADRSIMSQTSGWMTERKEAADTIADLSFQLDALIVKAAAISRRYLHRKDDTIEKAILALRDQPDEKE